MITVKEVIIPCDQPVFCFFIKISTWKGGKGKKQDAIQIHVPTIFTVQFEVFLLVFLLYYKKSRDIDIKITQNFQGFLIVIDG